MPRPDGEILRDLAREARIVLDMLREERAEWQSATSFDREHGTLLAAIHAILEGSHRESGVSLAGMAETTAEAVRQLREEIGPDRSPDWVDRVLAGATSLLREIQDGTPEVSEIEFPEVVMRP
jgi:hypothetical protein